MAVAWKKRLCTSSTTASWFACFGVMSESGRPASIPSSSCCSTLVTSWTMSILRIEVRSVWLFLTVLAVARMVIWETRKKVLYDRAKFSQRHLILFFRHQLRIKIRCNRKFLGLITFEKMWVHAASLVVRKGGNVGVIFLSSSCAWRRWSGSFGTSFPVSR